MSDCICCHGGHKNIVAVEGDRWCQQCQKDGCPQPRLKSKTEETLDQIARVGQDKFACRSGPHSRMCGPAGDPSFDQPLPDPAMCNCGCYLDTLCPAQQEHQAELEIAYREIKRREEIGP